MRSHVCRDCGQLVRHDRWTAHIAKHGRIVPDPHARTVYAEDETGEDNGE